MLIRTISLLLALFSALPAFAAPKELRSSDQRKVDFAYRNAAATDEAARRTVQFQGARDGSFRFDSACGASGERCECLFFRSSQDREPVRSAGSRLSRQQNVFSCTVPGPRSMPEYLTHALVRLRDGAQVTELASIRTALRLEHVLGGLRKDQVRGIFRYSCTRTFFEGEGVSEHEVACVPGQHLGVINATYNFYTFRSHFDGNFPGGDSAFPSDICQRNSFLKIQCTGNTPDLRFGLYKNAEGPFVVGISMTRAPEGDNLTSNYGHAALPDEHGSCAPGLVKARPWLAQPSSMIPSGPYCPADGCPSSFINSNNSLNNVVVETAQPANFQVLRQPNETPCDGTTGSCYGATFGGQQVAQSVPYVALSPVLCVIPPSLLDGIF